MIAFVRGAVDEIRETSVILDTGSIGYEIFMTTEDLSKLHVDDDVEIRTHFQVREDGMSLFGFLAKKDLQMFRLLLGVNGIGPKAAMSILSGISSDNLRFAILAEDVKLVSSAPGIGPKTAKKIILELKDRFTLEEAFESRLSDTSESGEKGPDGQSAGSEASISDPMHQDAIEALTALGYSSSEALRAVRQVTPEESESVESILKAALKFM